MIQNKYVTFLGFLLLAQTAFADSAEKMQLSVSNGAKTGTTYSIQGENSTSSGQCSIGLDSSRDLLGGCRGERHTDHVLGAQIGAKLETDLWNAETGINYGLRRQGKNEHVSLLWNNETYADRLQHVGFSGDGPELESSLQIGRTKISGDAKRLNLYNPSITSGMSDLWASNMATGRATIVNVGAEHRVGQNLKIKFEAINTNLNASGLVFGQTPGSVTQKSITTHQLQFNVGAAFAL